MLWLLWLLWVLVICGGFVGSLRMLRRAPVQAIYATVAVGLALALRLGHPAFYGLEYEDAFVYAAAARALEASGGLGWQGLQVCAVGSLDNCREWELFPGHLPGLPAALRAAIVVLGDYSELAPNVGAVLSSLAALFIWWATKVITNSFAAAAGASIVFAATPVFAVYGGSACSESASAVPVAVALGALSMRRRVGATREGIWWRALALACAVLAFSIRRENAVFLVILPACLMAASKGVRTRSRYLTLAPWIVLAGGAALLLSLSMVSEFGEYRQLSFSFHRFLTVLPVILIAFAHPKWFGLLAIVAVIGAILAIRSWLRNLNPPTDDVALIGCAGVTLVMMAMYAAHVRSTYQLLDVPVEPFDFLRYLNNVAVPTTILIGGAIEALVVAIFLRRSVWVYTLTALVALSYIGANVAGSKMLRDELTASEHQARIEPALQSLEVAAASDYTMPVITLEPMVLQVFAHPSAKVISLPFLTKDHLREHEGRALYISQDHYSSEADRQRYGDAFDVLPERRVERRRGRGWRIVSFGKEAK
jgi:hypothetical protein